MSRQKYQWVVVGAGPAGIASVGKLIDKGVDPADIVWIDPAFAVGDFGAKWRQVSSNTKVDLFIQFLYGCQSFDYEQCERQFALHDLELQQTCQLKYAADPLLWVTERLRQKVRSVCGWVQSLKMQEGYWHIDLEDESVLACNVVLAQGSEPKILPSYAGTPIIALEDALDLERLKQVVHPDDVVAVFGASHSGIIAIRLLLEAGVKQVINFYQGALRYAVEMEGWTLFDNTGLKGDTAVWALEHMAGVLPDRLTRVLSVDANIKAYLPQCTRVVHAVGFTRRAIAVQGFNHLDYDAKTGIIAPGLFGVGIAFPEEMIDPLGNVELSVGLWKFMRYLDRVVSVWMK